MSKALPRVTHLQFVVLAQLVEGEQPGREIRALLAGHGVRRSGPAFYQMMARLEDQGWVAGAYEQQVVAGQLIKERRYTLTAAGRRALAEARAFYAERLAALAASPRLGRA